MVTLLVISSLAAGLPGLIGPGPALPQTSGDMVAVPAGPFVRGATDGEPDELPVHRVNLPAFSIDRTEVTAEAYAACVAAGACPLPAGGPLRPDAAAGKLPAVGVSWSDAAAYCAWAGKRLPTEDEWEKAARGRDGRRYPWGDQLDCRRGNFGNFGGDGRCAAAGAPGEPIAVGSFASGASPYGALDMAGNVWEWVVDRYHVDAYRGVHPTESGVPDLRVLRGGGCCSIFGLPRAADRLALPKGYRDVDIGFRCALSGSTTGSGAQPATQGTPRGATRGQGTPRAAGPS